MIHPNLSIAACIILMELRVISEVDSTIFLRALHLHLFPILCFDHHILILLKVVWELS